MYTCLYELVSAPEVGSTIKTKENNGTGPHTLYDVVQVAVNWFVRVEHVRTSNRSNGMLFKLCTTGSIWYHRLDKGGTTYEY